MNFIAQLVPELVSELFCSGISNLIQRYGKSFESMVSDSLSELSKISPDYDPFSKVLSDIIKKGSIKIEQIADNKKAIAKELSQKVPESEFFKNYCDSETYPSEKIQEIIEKFLDIFETKICRNSELYSLLNLGYNRVILKRQEEIKEEIKKDIKTIKGDIISAFHKDIKNIPPGQLYDKSVSVKNELDKKSHKSKYLDIVFKYCIELQNGKKFNKALKYYKIFLKEEDADKHRKYFGALNNISIVLNEKGNHITALKYINKAYNVAPNRSVALLNLGLTYCLLRHYDRALDYMLKAKKKRKKDPKVYNTLAIIYAEKGQIDLAFKAINSAIQIDKRFAPAYINRAILYGGKKDFSKAKADVVRAINLDKNNAEFYWSYGAILQKEFFSTLFADIFIPDFKFEIYYIRSEDLQTLSNHQVTLLDKAIQNYETALKLGIDLRKSKIFHINLASCYHSRKRYKEAEKIYKNIETKPEKDFPWQGLGDLYFDTGRPKLAIKCYKKLASLYPENVYVITSLVRTYALINDLSKALVYAKKACELEPDEPRWKFNIGVTFERMKRLEDAQKIFEELKHSRFEIGDVNYHLGKIYFKQEMMSNAALCFLEAKKYGVRRELLSRYLADSSLLSFRLEEAEEEYKFLLSKNPEDMLDNFHYANLLEAKGNIKEAKKYYEKALTNPDVKKYPGLSPEIRKRISLIDEKNRIIQLPYK